MMFSGEDTDNTHSDDIYGTKEPTPPEVSPDGEKIYWYEDCAGEILPTSKSTIEVLLAKSQKYYQVNLCGKCANKRYKADHPDV